VPASLYMDEQVDSRVTQGLRRRGIDVLTVQEDGHQSAGDPSVLDRAATLNRVLFTHDRHFLAEAARRRRVGEFFAGIIFAPFSRVSIGDCVVDLEFLVQAGEPPDFENRVFFLPL